MIDSFFRYPHTPHLMWLGKGQPRDDKVLSLAEATAFLAGEVIVEEKVDGANVGFSLDEDGHLRAQNRGHYLLQPYVGQFSRLMEWIAVHGDQLSDVLQPNLIFFGEWCAARHSLTYDRLPDWWLFFDVYDKTLEGFRSVAARDEVAARSGFSTVAELFRGRISLQAIQQLLMETPSRYRGGPMEGVIVRSEVSDLLRSRAKLVRPGFAQSIDRHWRSRRVEWNRLKS
jgi:ATP-dependent RNA circularization protein (DNA/RNA ligase family)